MSRRYSSFIQAHCKLLIWFACLLAVVLLLSSGITYRILAAHLELIADTPINLPVPLSEFPTKVGNWTGEDVPIPESTQRAAQNDDFLNRLYLNTSNNEWTNVYIAYTARPRTMLGHKPQICYVGSGWVLDHTEEMEIISRTGRNIPCLIHYFHTPTPKYEERVILNYYIVNGQITNDESGFSGLGWRTPNISGNIARYVTQIQISSAFENSIISAAKDLTELILDYFPDAEGKTKAAENINSTDSTVK